MAETPWVAVADEAGNLSPTHQDWCLVIASLCVPNARSLELALRHIRKRLPMDLRGSAEFKFHRSPERLRRRLLTRLTEIPDLEVDVTLMDKRQWSSTLTAEEHYVAAIFETSLRLRARHPNLRLILDKRYTDEQAQKTLAMVVRILGRDYPEPFPIKQFDSQAFPALQTADFVVGAFFHREMRGNPDYAQIIQPKVVTEVWYGNKNSSAP